MRNFYLIFLLLLSNNYLLVAQDINSKVLISVDDENVTVEEFLRVYTKNLDLVKDKSQKEIDYYLDLYSNYKLKLMEARALEYDKKGDYITELNSYKKQLSKAYLTDKVVTDDLILEAYEHTANEVKVQHILVKLSPGQDTLNVYRQINLFKKRFENETFSKLKSSIHDGKSVFVEDLGYFSAFKMVYDFEKVAFNTPVNEISRPFKTQFGYHVLKVLDKRPSKGTIQVAHIMISNSNKNNNVSPENRINQLYNSLLNEASFEDLAKRFSDDKSSASRGGLMDPFSSGDLNSEVFVETAFNLNVKGQISKPIQTKFGWHILKLVSKTPVKSFDEISLELEQKVKRDSRSKIIKQKMISKLKNSYKVFEPALKNISSEILIEDDKFVLSGINFSNESIFIEIETQSYIVQDFLNFLNLNFKAYTKSTNFDEFFKLQYSVFLDQALFDYKKNNLINENKDYAMILKEYEEGLLLFDIMQEKIWNGAKNDSIGLKHFYNSNLSNYKSKASMSATVINSSSKSLLKDVLKDLKRGISNDTILKKFKQKDLIISSGNFDLDDKILPQDPKFQKEFTKSKIYKSETGYVCVYVNEFIPSKTLSFDKAKGSVISDFQLFLESDWMNELRKKHKLIIDKNVLKELKLYLNKQ